MGSDELVGRVARVLSDHELVINKGTDHAVKSGDYFLVIGPPVESVVNPDTDEEYTGIHHVKAVVVATEVAKRMTLAKTFLTESVNIGGAFSPGRAFSAPNYVERVQSLNADSSELPVVDEALLQVRTGDAVERVSSSYAKSGPKVTFVAES